MNSIILVTFILMMFLLSPLFVRYDLLIAHKEEIGQLITLEQGKPLKEAVGEVSHGLL